MDALTDADVMDRAAEIILKRSTKPDSISTQTLCKVLRRQAAKIRSECADEITRLTEGWDVEHH